MRTKKEQGYRAGDHIHFLVTDEFQDVANEFMIYCKQNSINTSGAIRMAMAEWLERKMAREKRLMQLERGTPAMRDMAFSYEREVLKEV